MLTYRSHIYNLAMSASAEATGLALSLSDLASHFGSQEYDEHVKEALPALVGTAGSLEETIDKFLSALPEEIRAKDRGLHRHIYWINRRIEERLPGCCTQDPIDIASMDIPSILERFDEWYENQSGVDRYLQGRLKPLIAASQLSSALREAWVIFKSRMVEVSEISETLDGHPLGSVVKIG